MPRYIPQGHRVPCGLTSFRDGYRIRVPVLKWWRRGYDIATDRFIEGWWCYSVCIRLERFKVSAHAGWGLCA